MLKTLKWVYGLAVQHERTRIARELESASARHHNEAMVVNDMLRYSDDKMPDNRKEKLKLKQAVHREVLEIINTIIEPRVEAESISSILEPDAKKVTKQRSL